MNRIKLFIFIILTFSNFSFALEKDRLVSFLKEYDASTEKYSGKVGYAIEKGYPDIAEFFILKGESINQYKESHSYIDDIREKMGFIPLNQNYIRHPLIVKNH